MEVAQIDFITTCCCSAECANYVRLTENIVKSVIVQQLSLYVSYWITQRRSYEPHLTVLHDSLSCVILNSLCLLEQQWLFIILQYLCSLYREYYIEFNGRLYMADGFDFVKNQSFLDIEGYDLVVSLILWSCPKIQKLPRSIFIIRNQLCIKYCVEC